MSNLTVNDVQPSDSMDYVCVASNILGIARASAYLTVYGELINGYGLQFVYNYSQHCLYYFLHIECSNIALANFTFKSNL